MRKERNRKDERNYKKNGKRRLASQAKGITLVALVITIIIIIILATVTIRFAFTDDGIIQRAERAGEMYANDTAYTDSSMANVVGYLDGILNGVAGGSGTGEGGNEPEVPEEPEQSEVQKAKEAGTVFADKTVITDGEGNKITIPKGFKIASDSGDTVQQGIVIEDVSASTDTAVQGSQYVWIPVGTFTKDDESTSNEIKLGRYTFSTTDGTTTEPLQYAEDYAGEPVTIKSFYTETTTYDAGNESQGSDGKNATAKNLAEFINSTKPLEEGGNGGYYIGRYEASYASGATSTTSVGDYANCKAASKVSTANSTSRMSYDPGTLWNFITQPAASKVAINTYEESESVKSDLMNSYAWDTAIVYIQEASTPNYANQKGTDINTSLTNTGANQDEVCKINDMASNLLEWTTEHSSATMSNFANPCVERGGYYYNSNYYTADRINSSATYSNRNVGFRLMLYV